MQSHPDIRFLATGDDCQNPSVEPMRHQYKADGTWDVQDIVTFMFPVSLKLNVIKRVKNESDRTAYPLIKEALFNGDKTVLDVVKENQEYFASTFDDISDVGTKMNICYLNETRTAVNEHVHGDKEIKKGQKKMILKGYIKNMTRNGTYVLHSVSRCIFKDDSGKKYNLTKGQYDLFELPYCWTSHAIQGMTITEEMSVFDVRKPKFVTKKAHAQAFWTAITRATTLKNVHVYVGESGAKNLSVASTIKRKIAGHKEYDVSKGFYDEENFVDERWVRKELKNVGRRCYHCNVELSWTGNTQFSIDRYNNDQGHTKENCSVICVSCNKGKH